MRYNPPNKNMIHKKIAIFLAMLSGLITSCSNSGDSSLSSSDSSVDNVSEHLNANQKTIQTIDEFPSRLDNYEEIDWQYIGKETDRVLFDFARNPEYQAVDESTGYPIGFWNDTQVNFPERSFGIPSYFGHYNKSTGEGTIFPGKSEGITALAAVLSASYMGIDKSKQTFTDDNGNQYTYDFVRMLNSFYNPSKGFVLNNQNTSTGSTFWYEIMPLLYFCRLYNLYPNEVWMRPIIIEMADKWLSAIPYLVDDEGNFSLEFTSFNFDTMKPYKGSWTESPVGGVSYLFYTAYMLTNEKKYLDGAIKFIDYVADRSTNPFYEVLESYIPIVAAVLNARHGKNYDIQRFINFSFGGDGDYRVNCQAGVSQWGDYPIYGLMALEYDKISGAGYTFSMNTFNLASNLAQTLRYDNRFADDLGKYFYNVANNAKIFYGRYLPDANHSCSKTNNPTWYANWTKADPNHVLCYEGVYTNNRKYDVNADHVETPYALGDATAMKWGQTDIGIYGSACVGFLAGMLRQTNVKEIWEVDLCKNDQLALEGDYQKYLYYNPYDSEKTVTIDLDGNYQMYDCSSLKLLSSNASGKFSFRIPSKRSVLLALVPTGVGISMDSKGVVTAGSYYLCKQTPIVQITSPNEVLGKIKKEVTVKFDYVIPDGDELEELSLYLGDELVASSKTAVDSFAFDSRKSEIGKRYLGSSVKTSLSVHIKTKKGSIDKSSIRVRLVNL